MSARAEVGVLGRLLERLVKVELAERHRRDGVHVRCLVELGERVVHVRRLKRYRRLGVDGGPHLPRRHNHADQRPQESARDDPDGRPEQQGEHHPDRGARARGDDLATPRHESDREARHCRREHDVEAEGRGIRDRAAQQVPGNRRKVPGDEHRHHAGDPVARHVHAPEAMEVRDRRARTPRR